MPPELPPNAQLTLGRRARRHSARLWPKSDDAVARQALSVSGILNALCVRSIAEGDVQIVGNHIRRWTAAEGRQYLTVSRRLQQRVKNFEGGLEAVMGHLVQFRS